MKKVKGVYTALVTPFNKKGEVDEEGFIKNVHHQLKNGVDGLVTLGTTGEAPTLSEKEKERLVKITVKETKGKAVVMIGTGSYSTEQTIKNTQCAEKLGADMALIVTPYYNKPTQEGLYRHFKTICENTKLPVLLYNIQGRTGQNIQTDTLKRLADIPQIIGVKEASGNITQINEVIEMIGRHRKDFCIMSGDDSFTLPIMALGGCGVISVVSNLLPKMVKELVQAMLKGDYEKAKTIHFELMPIFRGAFVETNPIPIKAAMELCGMASGPCRLPLCDLTENNQKGLQQLLKQYTTEVRSQKSEARRNRVNRIQ